MIDPKSETRELLSKLMKLCHDNHWDLQQLIDQTLARPDALPDASGSSDVDRPQVSPAGHMSRRVAVYIDSFDPPTCSHRETVRRLIDSGFDEVVVCPAGPKTGGGDHQHASPLHRAALVTLGFRGMEHVTVDYDDISLNQYTSPNDLASRHSHRGNVWLLLGDEQETIDGDVQSIKLHNDDASTESVSVSPNIKWIAGPKSTSASTVREMVYDGASIEGFVTPFVSDYIQRHKIFVPYSSHSCAYFQLSHPRLMIVSDPRNEKSRALAARYKAYESDDPQLILVLGGDGTMLHAIREHWRKRIPFVGLNTGHLGFLMNERLPDDLTSLPLISYSLPMLRVDTEAPDGTQTMGLAFSDVWLERAEGQAAWIRLDVDGETRMEKLVGDGMLVATASGSSAYARAMGAIPVPVNTPTLALVGSNIFQPRFWKPMVLPDTSVIRLASLDRSGKRPVRGFIDGTALGLVQQLTIRRSLTASVEMAYTREFDPSARLIRSLFPPDEA